jgi:hypothetical protein
MYPTANKRLILEKVLVRLVVNFDYVFAMEKWYSSNVMLSLEYKEHQALIATTFVAKIIGH